MNHGNSRSASQQIHCVLWKQNIHYHVNKSPQLSQILSQMNPIHISPPISLISIVISSSHLRLGL